MQKQENEVLIKIHIVQLYVAHYVSKQFIMNNVLPTEWVPCIFMNCYSICLLERWRAMEYLRSK